MFSDSTRRAVIALVAADFGATDEERRAVMNALDGMDGSSASPKADDLVISFTEASRRLGRRNPQFARNLAKAGKLRCVYGSGKGLRPCGVIAKSVEDFIARADGGGGGVGGSGGEG